MVKALKNNIWFQLKDFLFIVLGSFSYALAWQGFLIPNQLTTGAVTGLASIIYYAFGTPPVDVTYAVANVILLIFALKILGLKFCIRTIFGVFFCWLFLHILPLWIPNGLVQGDTFMASVIGGILCGVGLGVVFTSNGSTGGTDIIAAMVNKSMKKAENGVVGITSKTSINRIVKMATSGQRVMLERLEDMQAMLQNAIDTIKKGNKHT